MNIGVRRPAGLVLEPLPVGAWAMVAATCAVATKTLTFAQAFSAFTDDAIWLIVVAFFFARVSGGSGRGRGREERYGRGRGPWQEQGPGSGQRQRQQGQKELLRVAARGSAGKTQRWQQGGSRCRPQHSLAAL